MWTGSAVRIRFKLALNQEPYYLPEPLNLFLHVQFTHGSHSFYRLQVTDYWLR